jgi:hypothetical protein
MPRFDFEWVIPDCVGIYRKPDPKDPAKPAKTWQGAFHFPGRKREREGLGTKNKPQAQGEARKRYLFKLGRVDRDEPTREYKFEDCARELIKQLQAKVDAGKYSIVNVKAADRAIRNFLKAFQGTPIHRLNREAIASYFYNRKKKSTVYTANTQSLEVRYLKMIFKTAVRNGFIAESQIPYIESPVVERVRRAGITDEEFTIIEERMRKYAFEETVAKGGRPLSKKSIHMRMVGYFYTMTLIYSGIRTGNEIRYAKWKDVRFLRLSPDAKKRFPSMLPEDHPFPNLQENEVLQSTKHPEIKIPAIMVEPKVLKDKLKTGEFGIDELEAEVDEIASKYFEHIEDKIAVFNMATGIVTADVVPFIIVPKKNAKTRERRLAFSHNKLASTLLFWFRTYLPQSPESYIFSKLDGSFVKTSPSLFEKVLQELDNEETDPKKKTWKVDEEGRARTLYSCRHRAITEAISSGLDITLLEIATGSSSKMFKEYYFDELNKRQAEQFRYLGQTS